MIASAAMSPVRSLRWAPFRVMPRMMRRKWVSGSAVDSTCAGRGMASNGNMNPDSRMLGSRKKNDICIACCWVRASVEKNSPSARLAAMNRNGERVQQASAPRIGDAEDDPARQQDDRHLHVADGDVGQDLAHHQLQAADGETISCSSVPRSRSRAMAIAVSMTMVMVRITPTSPGTTNTAVRSSGLYQVFG
jgi:hypothetical protein